ncbi:calcyclin-binding protein [Aethina tumida]|uniref:calcyclin-binding protein n=1 Tax=Aethina tumida TaxID=116153 RepID=UPI00096AFAB1|nr:calcyclin-binding protein [Aethina tumida]
MSNKITELKLDVAELETLEKQSTRQKIKDILSIEKRKLISEIVKLEEENNLPDNVPVKSTQAASTKRYQVKINNYAWDQTNKFVKFYVTLKNVHTIPADNVKCSFRARALELTVDDLDNKDHVFTISKLLEDIEPDQSNWKVKTDMVIINAAKKTQNKWSHVTSLEKKASDAQKMDTENMDPADGIMSLMKNMYEKGDDEMKRTIAKAWTESRNKGGLDAEL